MSDQITYNDKADLIVDTTIDDMFKVSASDMNEIKNVVNSHADDIDVANNNINDLNNNKLDINEVLNQSSTDTDKPYSANYLNDKLVSVGSTAPENGERVWFKKGKNLLSLNRAEVAYSVGIVLNESNMYSNMAYDGGIGTANTQNVVDGETLKVTSRYSQGVGFPIKCKPNEQYTLTLSNTNSLGSVCILFFDENNTYLSNSGNSHIETLSVTTPSNCKWLVTLFDVTGGTKTEVSFSNIQLEEGSTATTYEPYIEKSINVDDESFISMSDLVSVGANQPSDGRRVFFAHSKNVLQHSAYDRTLNGVTLKVNDDKSITLTGTATANTNFNIGTNATLKLKAGTYTFTKGATNVQALIYYSSASVLANLPIGTASQTITINKDTTYENYRVVISIPNGTQINEIVYPMLRLSTTSNTYEPYIEKSINVDDEEWYSKPKVLWTNPNPTSNFASQTITLNDSLANYSYYEVLYKTYKDENIGYNTGKIPTNWGTNIYGIVNANDGGVRNRMRSVTINSSTQIEISSCSLINTKGDAYTFPNDDRLIPFKILGYKE